MQLSIRSYRTLANSIIISLYIIERKVSIKFALCRFLMLVNRDYFSTWEERRTNPTNEREKAEYMWNIRDKRKDLWEKCHP